MQLGEIVRVDPSSAYVRQVEGALRRPVPRAPLIELCVGDALAGPAGRAPDAGAQLARACELEELPEEVGSERFTLTHPKMWSL